MAFMSFEMSYGMICMDEDDEDECPQLMYDFL